MFLSLPFRVLRNAVRSAGSVRPPETAGLASLQAGGAWWQAEAAHLAAGTPEKLTALLTDDGGPGALVAFPTDADHALVMAPADPVVYLLRHRAAVDALAVALGQAQLFEAVLLPVIAGWAAAVQSLPRDLTGLWSGPDGLFEAGLTFAREAVASADAHVIELEMPPIERAAWTERLRVAVAIAGLFADASRLFDWALTAVTLNRHTGTETLLETYHPAQELLLSFAVRHEGQTLKLARHPAGHADRAAITPGLTLFHQLVPGAVQQWLAAIARADGETVAEALSAVLAYGAGTTVTQKFLLEAVTDGVSRALNRRAAKAAAREGKSPLLAGFAARFKAALTDRIFTGQWLPNGAESPLVYAEDGFALPWPGGLIALFDDAGNRTVADLPEEPELAAQILVAQGLVLPDLSGRADRALSEKAPERLRSASSRWIRLTGTAELTGLAARAARVKGKPLPEALPALFEAPRTALTEGKAAGIPKARFVWRAGWTSQAEPNAINGGPAVKTALLHALERLSDDSAAPSFAVRDGVFVAMEFLPEDFDVTAAARAELLMSAEAQRVPGQRVPRPQWRRRACLSGGAARCVGAVRIGSDHENRLREKRGANAVVPFIADGVVLRATCVQPAQVWPDGGAEDRTWPEPDGSVVLMENGEMLCTP